MLAVGHTQSVQAGVTQTIQNVDMSDEIGSVRLQLARLGRCWRVFRLHVRPAGTDERDGFSLVRRQCLKARAQLASFTNISG